MTEQYHHQAPPPPSTSGLSCGCSLSHCQRLDYCSHWASDALVLLSCFCRASETAAELSLTVERHGSVTSGSGCYTFFHRSRSFHASSLSLLVEELLGFGSSLLFHSLTSRRTNSPVETRLKCTPHWQFCYYVAIVIWGEAAFSLVDTRSRLQIRTKMYVVLKIRTFTLEPV